MPPCLPYLLCLLCQVINDDYNDFVSLSTKLVNVDGALARMQAPLLELQVRQLLCFIGARSGSESGCCAARYTAAPASGCCGILLLPKLPGAALLGAALM